jgi:2-oxoglutarate dehydrogenase E1 component
LKAILKKYSKATSHIWAQEEPENMGAWSYVLRVFREVNLKVISRRESASPATGSHQTHEKEQKGIVDAVFESII